jgi:hypothetical protein
VGGGVAGDCVGTGWVRGWSWPNQATDAAAATRARERRFEAAEAARAPIADGTLSLVQAGVALGV